MRVHARFHHWSRIVKLILYDDATLPFPLLEEDFKENVFSVISIKNYNSYSTLTTWTFIIYLFIYVVIIRILTGPQVNSLKSNAQSYVLLTENSSNGSRAIILYKTVIQLTQSTNIILDQLKVPLKRI